MQCKCLNSSHANLLRWRIQISINLPHVLFVLNANQFADSVQQSFLYVERGGEGATQDCREKFVVSNNVGISLMQTRVSVGPRIRFWRNLLDWNVEKEQALAWN